MNEEDEGERKLKIQETRRVYDKLREMYLYGLRNSLEENDVLNSKRGAKQMREYVMSEEEFLSYFPRNLIVGGKVMTLGQAHDSMTKTIQRFVNTVRDIVTITKTQRVEREQLQEAIENLITLTLDVEKIFGTPVQLDEELINRYLEEMGERENEQPLGTPDTPTDKTISPATPEDAEDKEIAKDAIFDMDDLEGDDEEDETGALKKVGLFDPDVYQNTLDVFNEEKKIFEKELEMPIEATATIFSLFLNLLSEVSKGQNEGVRRAKSFDNNYAGRFEDPEIIQGYFNETMEQLQDKSKNTISDLRAAGLRLTSDNYKLYEPINIVGTINRIFSIDKQPVKTIVTDLITKVLDVDESMDDLFDDIFGPAVDNDRESNSSEDTPPRSMDDIRNALFGDDNVDIDDDEQTDENPDDSMDIDDDEQTDENPDDSDQPLEVLKTQVSQIAKNNLSSEEVASIVEFAKKIKLQIMEEV